ncbi:MAG: response regulator [Thermodesulfobacteriota bacterium]
MKILVVDDEQAVLDVLRRILEPQGYECAFAASAAGARRLLKGQRFDLLISDILMPGESGLELIQSVADRYPDMCVVVISGADDFQASQAALALGVYGYVVKPFDVKQILITVANALRRQELERRERAYREDLEKAVEARTAELRKAREQLEIRSQDLSEMNSALGVLLKRREEDRSDLEKNMMESVKKRVDPYLERLRMSRLSDAQRRIVGILESNIRELVSPFARELSSSYLGLTPTEVQVADLIKQGKNSKEIAAVLNLSLNTVMTHRYRIRSKLRLLKSKTSLQTFLRSLK